MTFVTALSMGAVLSMMISFLLSIAWLSPILGIAFLSPISFLRRLSFDHISDNPVILKLSLLSK